MSDKTHRVFIHKNEASSESKILLISEDISLTSLKKIAGEKLGLKRVKKVFLSNGVEVTSMDDIQQNENLYFSTGEIFYRTSVSGTTTDKMNVSILGGGGVGKSAITLRFVRDFFIKNWEATIEDAYRKTVRVDDEVSVLEILDTAGQEDFSTLRAQWMMDKDGYIFVYSLIDKGSLDQLTSFIELLEQTCTGKSQVPPVIFVGNKKDLTDNDPDLKAVTSEDVEKVIQSCKMIISRLQSNTSTSAAAAANQTWSVLHYETSALNGERIDEIFEVMIREIRKRRQPVVKQKSSWCFLF